jgi:hypothetical protein
MTDNFPPGEARAGSEQVLAHLIVVAGLKGAGKSTFIQSIRQRTLSPAIAALLPQGAARWPEFPAGEAATWLPVLLQDSRSTRTGILHYDLDHFSRAGKRHASATAMTLARNLTVINMVPTLAQLTSQFNRRESQALLLHQLGPSSNNAGNATSAERIRIRRSRVLNLYATPGWADEMLLSWNAFVREAAAGANLLILEIEPEGVSGAVPGWRLKSASHPGRLK